MERCSKYVNMININKLASRPLVFITAAFASGIAISSILVLSPWVSFLASILVAVLAGAIFFVLRRDVYPVLLIVFILLGVSMASAERGNPWPFGEKFLGKMVTLEGYVLREPDVRKDKTIYLLEVEKVLDGEQFVEAKGRVLLRITGSHEGLDYGDVVRVKGNLYMPGNPGNPGQFDYGKYLSARGIWALLFVKDNEFVEKTLSSRGNVAAWAALGIKNSMMEVVRDTLEPDHASLINGIVFGSRGEIAPRIKEVFNESGVVHILTVSGLHVGLVAAVVLVAMNMFGLQRFSFPLLTVVLLLYTYITGMGPAVVRAALMVWVQLLGQSIGRERDWPTTLALSGLVILAFSPLSLFEPGFQLSFTATWGILHIGPAIDKRLEMIGIKKQWVRGVISIPMAAQAGILPLIAYHYNIMSFISVPANILAVPLVGLILPLGFLAALAGTVYLKIALIVNFATSALLDLMILIVGVIHSIPGGVIYVVQPNLAIITLWYVSLAFIGSLAKEQGQMKVYQLRISCFLVASLLVFLLIPGGFGEKTMQVHVIDVGQGDSILVRFVNGRNMLVDAGGWRGEFNEGHGAGEVVAAYLRRLGIKKLDVLLLTHPHEDHAAGALYLYGRFEIGAVLISPVGIRESEYEKVDSGYSKMIAMYKKGNVPVREVVSGDFVNLDSNVQVEVIWPAASLLSGSGSDMNNNSVVLSIRYGENSFLLSGDIEEQAQKTVLEMNRKFEHDVLKVPHHGSRYILPEFIDWVNPSLSVISVGKNSFGQPDLGTVDLVSAGGRPVYRTDLNWLVVFSSDGKQINVITSR